MVIRLPEQRVVMKGLDLDPSLVQQADRGRNDLVLERGLGREHEGKTGNETLETTRKELGPDSSACHPSLPLPGLMSC